MSKTRAATLSELEESITLSELEEAINFRITYNELLRRKKEKLRKRGEVAAGQQAERTG